LRDADPYKMRFALKALVIEGHSLVRFTATEPKRITLNTVVDRLVPAMARTK